MIILIKKQKKIKNRGNIFDPYDTYLYRILIKGVRVRTDLLDFIRSLEPQ